MLLFRITVHLSGFGDDWGFPFLILSPPHQCHKDLSYHLSYNVTKVFDSNMVGFKTTQLGSTSLSSFGKAAFGESCILEVANIDCRLPNYHSMASKRSRKHKLLVDPSHLSDLERPKSVVWLLFPESDHWSYFINASGTSDWKVGGPLGWGC